MVQVIGHYSETKLTGRQRVRRGWFGKLVLQVEVEEIYLHPLGHEWRRNPQQSTARTRWRDATETDVGLKHAMVNVYVKP